MLKQSLSRAIISGTNGTFQSFPGADRRYPSELKQEETKSKSNMKHRKKILIAAGGTGGHILPALSIAEGVQSIDSSFQIEFVCGSSDLEKNIYSASAFICHSFSVGRLRKNVSWQERWKTFFSLPFLLLKALSLVIKVNPALVLGTGGAVSGPILLSAFLLRKKTIIFEPNAVPGLANRWLSPFMDRVVVVFDETKIFFKTKKTVQLPYPVRSQISRILPKSQPSTPFRILILGGSQGSSFINRVVSEFIISGRQESVFREDDCSREKKEEKSFTDTVIHGRHTFSFVHQTGKKDFENFQKIYSGFENVRVFPFLYKMHEFYEWADIVVGRAGTGTIAELSAVGRAGILVPLAGSADQHQLRNIQSVEKKSAVIFIEEKDFNKEKLKDVLKEMANAPRIVSQLSCRIHQLKLGGAGVDSVASWLIGYFSGLSGKQLPPMTREYVSRNKGTAVSHSMGFFTPGVRVHFVGIGGIGMCGLAELLCCSGSFVTGSDLVENAHIKKLRELNIPVFIGHKKENISNVEILIQSSAVPDNNIEIQSAKKRNIPVIKRSEALAEVMRLKRGLVVAGTHGKTTTAHLLAQIFIHNKQDPTVIIGGRSLLFQSTAFPGAGEWFIAESDESDGGFKNLSPEIAVITNIDRDHLDYYGSFENLKSAFLNFILKIPFYGCIVAWGDQKVLYDLLSGVDRKVIFYGFNENNHFILKKTGPLKYRTFVNKKELGILNMPLPGSMNALNTLAACATAMTIGCSFQECKKSFQSFKGVDRRFHKKAEWQGIEFYDDYAHHPTEVRAILSAFREKFGKDKRLIVLFQPHRFSRTADCWQDFLTCFAEADQVFLMDIYPAGESALEGVSSEILAGKIKNPPCSYCSEGHIFSLLSDVLKKGDIFITMGAGSVYKHGEHFFTEFVAKRET